MENPFGDKFWEAWALWKEYKQEAHKFKYKGPISEQVAINGLVELSDFNEQKAIAIIRRSMGNQWKGFHPLQPTKNEPISNTTARQSLNDALNKRFGAGQ